MNRDQSCHGDHVEAGRDILADGASTWRRDGSLQEPLIGFMTWEESYNYEDAAVK